MKHSAATEPDVIWPHNDADNTDLSPLIYASSIKSGTRARRQYVSPTTITPLNTSPTVNKCHQMSGDVCAGWKTCSVSVMTLHGSYARTDRSSWRYPPLDSLTSCNSASCDCSTNTRKPWRINWILWSWTVLIIKVLLFAWCFVHRMGDFVHAQANCLSALINPPNCNKDTNYSDFKHRYDVNEKAINLARPLH